MKLRWLVRRNEVTAMEVREYALANDLPMMEAKQQLVNETKPVLQYHTLAGGWQDVPVEVLTNNPK
jgi:hypothetical protein